MFDFAALSAAVEAHDRAVRLVVAEAKGSAPREAGADMLIWDRGQEGTIGGGRLEFDAIKAARAILHDGPDTRVQRLALGPALGQCCGGAVTLVFERFEKDILTAAATRVEKYDSYTRRVGTGATAMPKAMRIHLDQARAAEQPVSVRLTDGWLCEPIWRARLPVYIYGAGHVGRAIALALAPLPQFEVHLVDVREDQFYDLPVTIHQSWELLPTDVLASAPDHAAHFIMTPEHDYDLELCHRLLSRSFGYAGLIGSGAKWARFRTRLAALGHSGAQIARIECPIGDPSLGKHPQAIAIGIVSHLLAHQQRQSCLQRSIV